MVQEKFTQQIDRLKANYGDLKYKGPRVHLLWECFKKYPDSYMERATTKFILNKSTPPMHEDYLKQFTFYELQDRQRKDQDKYNSEDPVEYINNLQKETDADAEFVAECNTILSRKMRGQITIEEFHKEMDRMHQLALEVMAGGRNEEVF